MMLTFVFMLSRDNYGNPPTLNKLFYRLNTRLRDIENSVEENYGEYYRDDAERMRYVIIPISKYIEANNYSEGLTLTGKCYDRVIDLILNFEYIINTEKDVRDEFDTCWEDSPKKQNAIRIINELQYYKNELSIVITGLKKHVDISKPFFVNSFLWHGTEEELHQLFTSLSGNFFDTDIETFKKAFSGRKIKLLDKIKWLKKPERGKHLTSPSTIFNFLFALHDLEKLNVSDIASEELNNSIRGIFCYHDSSEFEKEKMRSYRSTAFKKEKTKEFRDLITQIFKNRTT